MLRTFRTARHYSTKFKLNELVICQPLNKTASDKKWLSRPLEEGQKFNINTGFFTHEEIIGSHSRSKVFTHTGKKGQQSKYILSKPTTEEYINLISRDAQPIYPMDAAAIANLADLHIDYPERDLEGNIEGQPLQFFEAGTGHGSLTLQILKNLHPANCFVKQPNGEVDLTKRGAVLHSIDCNERHSQTGTKTVTKFKGGMYINDVEFHISESPTKWLQEESEEWSKLSLPTDDLIEFEDEKAFLNGAFLDMGGFEEHLKVVSQHMKLDAPLVVFCPSVSQIMDALKVINDDPEIKLQFVKTVQILDGAGGGLKEWDTRKAFIRATGETGWVCRPKVGIRTCGGGFVIVFRKMSTTLDIEKENQEMKESNELAKKLAEEEKAEYERQKKEEKSLSKKAEKEEGKENHPPGESFQVESEKVKEKTKVEEPTEDSDEQATPDK